MANEQVVLTREYNAPRKLVFEAFSTAEHVEKWIAPDGFTARCKVEFRVGGAFDVTMIGMGMNHTAYGRLREIVPLEKIVWSFEFEDVRGKEITTTVTFEAVSENKTRLTVRQVFPAWESLTPAEQQTIEPRLKGAPIGWNQSLDHLAQVLS